MVAVMAPATLSLPPPYPKHAHNLQQQTQATHSIAYPKRKNSSISATYSPSLEESPFNPNLKTDYRRACNHCASLLQYCVETQSLAYGRQLHARVLIGGLQEDLGVTHKIINMYAACGLFTEAVKVFESVDIDRRDVYLWTGLIIGYVKFEKFDEAIDIYRRMQKDEFNVKPDHYTFSSLLKACAGSHALQLGRQIHVNIIRSGYESYDFVSTTLVDMYAKCSSIEDARKVLNEMSSRDFVTLNSMIAGYAQNECWKEALDLFRDMVRRGLKPDSVTVTSVLPAFSEPDKCREIHAYAVRNEFQPNVVVGNALLSAYAKCWRVDLSRRLFAGMPDKDVVSWAIMIAGYVEKGDAHAALELFYKMIEEGVVKPNSLIISTVLRACALVARKSLRKGKIVTV